MYQLLMFIFLLFLSVRVLTMRVNNSHTQILRRIFFFSEHTAYETYFPDARII